ncbi:type II secretion system minor pseudopilin GspI [Halioxenophilus sp. WMMB6]|uniref:type II secretion system minor pseudopilin GspI n=1 Tax=Halioxenophilus sp. WMMB6 TaxID=3073815 RepID=UPI00295E5671|nr:type II secretion system minor pseudopilin GspI [Halioxenophilus sp. WMMB6]
MRVGIGNRRQARGFTLIEVMVALVIVAVALPALLNLMLTQSNNVSSVRLQTLADYVASNQLNTHRLNYQLTGRILNGRQTGSEELAGIEWFWLAESQVTDVDAIRKLTVSVGQSAEQAADNPITQLSGFVYEPQ